MMGLNMYLYANKYIGNWNHSEQAEKDEYNRVATAVGLAQEDFTHMTCSGQSIVVNTKVACWSRANQIHKWFVDNCQGGNDDCGEYYVSREQLAELVALCKQVLGTLETVEGEIRMGTTYHPDGRVVKHKKTGQVVAQAALADRMLPTQDGFFFGSTGYDEYYLSGLRKTVSQIEAVLSNPKFNDWEFEYSSSW